MEKEKLEALYLAALSYSVYAYENIPTRKDRVYRIMAELSKRSKKIIPDKELNQLRTKHWFEYFRDIEIEAFGNNQDFSPELLALVILQYLVSEHNYKNLQVKYSCTEMLDILDSIEREHNKLTLKAYHLISDYLDSKTYVDNR